MRLRRFPASIILPALSLAFLLVTSPARAAFINLGPAGDYNIFVLNDHAQSNTDAEGKVAIGHNGTFTNFTIASKLGNGTNNLIVGNNLTNSSTTFHGGMIVNGNLNWDNPTILGAIGVNGNATLTGNGSLVGPVSVVGTYTAPNYFPPVTSTAPTPLPFSFAAVGAYLQAQSTYLASLPTNGTTKIEFDQVHLTANNPLDTYVSFNVTGAQMAAAAGHGLFITAPVGATVVVNVDGSSSAMQNMGIFLTGVDKQHVLYNFSQATDLKLGGIGVLGTILAPLADVDFASGNIDGTLIAKNLTGGGESHLYLFQGNLPVVPEPTTLAMSMFGAAALIGVALRRRVMLRTP
jgi:choice-of-anchor A domain-containing protein